MGSTALSFPREIPMPSQKQSLNSSAIRDLNEQRSVSNGMLVGSHEVLMERPGDLWLAATNVDAALELRLEDGECVRSYWPRRTSGCRPLLV